MVFSTTGVVSDQFYGSPYSMIKKHIAHCIAGLLVLTLFLKLNPRFWLKYANVIAVTTLVGLVLVLVPWIGHSAGGARRWIVLGPLRIQPGEFAKLASVVFTAAYIHRSFFNMRKFVQGLVYPSMFLVSAAALLLMEPDFGSTAVIFGVMFLQLAVYARLSHIGGLSLLGVLALGMLVLLSPYRFRRFVSFLNPFDDPSGSGYQLLQSLVAVGSGGFWGEGLGVGQQKLFYLPAAHTDFIFAVIAEEIGLFGCAIVLTLFLLFLWRGIRISLRLVKVPFLSSLALGCTLLTVLPAFLNVGVVTGILPTKGLVLPLVAYGGS
ncbi:UNVERIFIED_CONTAM: hypothetical protein GTU68_048441, partial [Idotea baltica]|nr:hypothetical protein [Idotea baltica]